MDLWLISGIFLLGAGAGALTTVALHVKQIRQLKDQLKASHDNPKNEEERGHSEERKSA